MPHKIGVYIRVSTEEQAQVVEGSLESQKHRLKNFIEFKNDQEKRWGKLVESYVDDGFSAKDTRRPAYQRMLRDIRARKIDMILVTDLSRLSRNISDFCGLLEELELHKAKFLSIKEQFDTSTPVGEMMIYNMINLAQFERKQTSERVSMNFHSRALRGLKNGGNALLGYDRDPENSGRLIVNLPEAPGVRQIFKTYLETASLRRTAVRLNGTTIRPKVGVGRKARHANDGRWTVDSVRSILTNHAYIGKREINKRHKNEPQETLKPWQRYQIVKASWPGIVDEDVFSAVQRLFSENLNEDRRRRAQSETRFFALSRVIRCGECGMALIGQTSHGSGQAHRYYGHKAVAGEVIRCSVKRIRADDVEQAVVTHLSEILLRGGHLDRVEQNIKKSIGAQAADLLAQRDRTQREMVAVDSDIESAMQLTSKLGSSPDALALIQDRLEQLAARKKSLAVDREMLISKIDAINEARASRAVIEERSREFQKGWSKATDALKRRLIRRTLHAVIYNKQGLETYYVTGEDHPVSRVIQPRRWASEFDSEAGVGRSFGRSKRQPRPLFTFGCESVLSVGSGGPGRNRTDTPCGTRF